MFQENFIAVVYYEDTSGIKRNNSRPEKLIHIEKILDGRGDSSTKVLKCKDIISRIN
jgi:hypothetical protein